MQIPEKYFDLFDKAVLGGLATVNPDNSPQLTPLWVYYNKEENHIVLNTAKGRKKYRNMINNSKVAILLIDPENPYRYVSIQGRIIEVNDNQEEALAVIDMLSRHYRNSPWKANANEERVTFKIEPKYVSPK